MRVRLIIVLTFLFTLLLPNIALAYDIQEAELLGLINDYRAGHGLSTLRFSAALSAAAENHSRDMAVNGYFSHTGLDGSTPWDRIKAQGYAHNTALGENLAAGFSSPSQTLQGWIDSPGHNAILLEPDYVVVGMGYVYEAGSKFKFYWTADFGGYNDGASLNQLKYTSLIPNTCYWSQTVEIDIYGAGFTPETQAALGDILFVDPVYYNQARIRISVPADARRGKWTLTLQNPDGNKVQVPDAFEVLDPVARHDFDHNREIDIFDLIAISRQFGQSRGAPSWNSILDIDGSGVIDIFDLITVSRNFGARY